MMANNISPKKRPSKTLSWRNSPRYNRIPYELHQFLSEYDYSLPHERFSGQARKGPEENEEREDDEFDLWDWVEVRADLKREVYITGGGHIVIDDELVHDVAELTVQSVSSPSGPAFSALLTRNVCDYLLACGAFPAALHFLQYSAREACLKLDATPVKHLPTSYDRRSAMMDEIELAVRTIYIVHECGHLASHAARGPAAASASVGWDEGLEYDADEELECDAAATNLLVDFHGYHSVIVAAGDDIDIRSGFSHTLPHYEFVIHATLLTGEIAKVAELLLGGKYDHDHCRKRVAFAKRRAVESAASLHAQTEYLHQLNAKAIAQPIETFQAEVAALIDRLVACERVSSEIWEDLDLPFSQKVVNEQRERLKPEFNALCDALGLVRRELLLIPNGAGDVDLPCPSHVMPEPHRDRGPLLPGAEFRHRLFRRHSGNYPN